MPTLNEGRLKKEKRKRNSAKIVLTIIMLLLVPEVAHILHQILSVGRRFGDLTLDINYINAIRSLINEQEVQRIGILLILGIVILQLYLSMDMKQQISKIDTMFITPNIEIPVPAGNGQHGNARFQTDKEKKAIYEKYVIPKNGKLKKIKRKGGLVVHFEEKKDKTIYYYLKEKCHSIIIAITGAGKTRGVVLQTLFLLIMSGISAVTTDVKGEIWSFTARFAKMMGYKTPVLDLRNPKRGMRINYLQPILDALETDDIDRAIDSAWDLTSALVGEAKGEPLWTNGECATITASILAVAMEAPKKCRNMTNAYFFISNMCKTDEEGEMAISKYLETLPETHPSRTCFAMAELAPSRTRGSFFTSALGTLRLFANPSIASMTSESDFSLKDIGKEKTILYIKIPDEKKTYYPLVSLLVTQLYSEQVAVADENGKELPVPTDYVLDEIGNCPKIPSLPSIITAGRSRGITANLFIQDYQQIEKLYEKDYETIIGNCGLKVFLKGDSEKTLKSISEKLNKYTVEVKNASTGINDGKKMQSNYSSGSALTGRSLLSVDELALIKPPHALVMVTGERGAINILPDISKTEINKHYGMGDKEHNRKLIMEREAEVIEREREEIVLWGIWNDYKKVEKDADAEINERVSFLKFSEG